MEAASRISTGGSLPTRGRRDVLPRRRTFEAGRRAIGLDDLLQQRPRMVIPARDIAVADDNVEVIRVAVCGPNREDPNVDTRIGRHSDRCLQQHVSHRHHARHPDPEAACPNSLHRGAQGMRTRSGHRCREDRRSRRADRHPVGRRRPRLSDLSAGQPRRNIHEREPDSRDFIASCSRRR